MNFIFKNYKFLIFLFIFVLAILFFYELKKIKKHKYVKSKNSNFTIKFEDFDFSIKEVSLSRRSKDKVLLLYAKEITQRNRKSSYFKYHNLKEIIIYDANIYLEKNLKHFNLKNSFLFSEKSKNFFETDTDKDTDENVTNENVNIITRIIFLPLSINLKISKNKIINIVAEEAYTVDFENFLLKNAIINTSYKAPFYASQAILSIKYNGIYFPQGYKYKNKIFNHPAYFKITNKGLYIKFSNIPSIMYRDLVEEKEKEFLSKFSKKLPFQNFLKK